jgi:hypothetical protein
MNPRSFLRLVLVLSAAVLATAVALGGAELVLVDGRVVRGESARRDGDVYVLTTDSGDLTMPVDLVDQVRLTGPAETEPPAIKGIPEGPTGFRAGGPETLAGTAIAPSTPADQLAVFGKPAEFKKGTIDPTWTPKSAYDPNVDVLADSRSTWKKSSIDPTWTPKSAYDPNVDVLADSRSTWQKSSIDSTWTPTDGFKKSAW